MAALLAPASATAATITVVSAADDSATECTLRDAIEAAKLNAVVDGCGAGEASPALDTIRFALPSGARIGLMTALPTVEGPLRIEGPGAAELSISGEEANRVLRVSGGQAVAVAGLTITEGRCNGSCEGAGILNDGDLTLEEVVVTQNRARSEESGNNFPTGAGIYNIGQLRLVFSTVSDNHAEARGGEMQNAPIGGGIRNLGSLVLDRSTVSGNSAEAEGPVGSGTTNAVGGGIANSGDLMILHSSVIENFARGEGSTVSDSAFGGGIQSVNPALPTTIDIAIEDSTIAQNRATVPDPNGGDGGGIAIPNAATLRLIGSTVVGNEAGSAANIVANSQATTVRSTIVAEPGGGSSCAGPLPSSGFNLEDGTGCGFTAATDLSSVDPMLETLADNGGSTMTMALEEGSPAIDRGFAGAGEATDQRGLPRRSDFPAILNAVGGDGADIGAVELQGGLLPGEAPPAGPPAPIPPAADVTAPRLKLGRGPGKSTFDRTPTFRFGSEPGARFGCKVDKGRFISCRSPFTTKRLSFGKHRVKLRAIDAAGNASAVAVRSFEVLRPHR